MIGFRSPWGASARNPAQPALASRPTCPAGLSSARSSSPQHAQQPPTAPPLVRACRRWCRRCRRCRSSRRPRFPPLQELYKPTAPVPQPRAMLRALAAGHAAPQLLAAARAGACGALASGVLRRGLAAMVEPTAFPPADRDSFHYAVLQAPLMQVRWDAAFATGHGARTSHVVRASKAGRSPAGLIAAAALCAGGDGWQPASLPAALCGAAWRHGRAAGTRPRRTGVPGAPELWLGWPCRLQCGLLGQGAGGAG